jgi:hypothetical protein
VDEAIFCSATQSSDPGAREPLAEILREGAAQIRAPCLDPRDAAALQHAGKSANRRLDFGKLRHRRDMAEEAQAR